MVALNPWVYPDDDADLAGRRVLFVHGRRDRIASTGSAPRPSPAGSPGTPTSASSGSPTASTRMLRHGRDFDRYAAQFTAAVLLDDPALATGPVVGVLAGEAWVTV